jgi:hypothetical protein
VLARWAGFGGYRAPAAGGGALRDRWGQGNVGPACSLGTQLRCGACGRKYPAVEACTGSRSWARAAPEPRGPVGTWGDGHVLRRVADPVGPHGRERGSASMTTMVVTLRCAALLYGIFFRHLKKIANILSLY